MIQGTSSDAGKSLLVMALCRIFADEGYRVAPFKAQNMSSNVDIIDGLEIARIQSLQAFAARTKPSVYMNPILLKPMGDYLSKVIVLGREYSIMHAKDYYQGFAITKGLECVKLSIRELADDYEIIVMEGAGSPAEINLQDYDIANMKLAEMFDVDTIIIADIERGGCFASMLGTLELIKQKELVKGFIINRFRGDVEVLKPAIDAFERLSNKPILGVIPYINTRIPKEDTLSLHDSDDVNALVIRYPNASNLSEIDLLSYLNLGYAVDDVVDASLIILPPSRDIKADLKWLNDTGFGDWIRYNAKRGKKIIGIEEGYAMLTSKIIDLDGLGILDAKIRDIKKINRYAEVKINNSFTKCFINTYFDVESKAKGLIARLDGEHIIIGLIDRNVIGYSAYGIIEHIANMLNVRVRDMLDEEIDKIARIVRDSIDLDRIMRIIGLT